MVSVDEAKEMILAELQKNKTLYVSLCDAAGLVLAENIIAPVSLPPFDQSAMDGYAFRWNDFSDGNKIRITGEIPAGKISDQICGEGEAMRIFTGAAVPQGADTVVMQEYTSADGNLLSISEHQLLQGANIRKTGAQIYAGDTALQNGTVLSAGAVGYLAAMGVQHVRVYARPRITILVTGSELQQAGNPLGPGQIYESNSAALVAALRLMNLDVAGIVHLHDDEKNITDALKKALAVSDLVLMTGGISVGDYDFAAGAMKACDIRQVFYKISQKPGKPLYCGVNKDAMVFGLPGNPASVLTCFYEYVYPAIRKKLGFENYFLPKAVLPLAKDVKKKKGLSNFLKGKITGDSVLPLEGQESFVLSSFALADVLIYIPSDTDFAEAGTPAEVHFLPR